MTQRSVVHGTFTLERIYPASPERVFSAWADQKSKARWFAIVERWEILEYRLDFQVGGREIWRGGPQGETVHRNETIFRDIVPNRRIIYAYDMFVGDTRHSVSLATVLFEPHAEGTRLTFTEQGAYLDGVSDGPEGRLHGWGVLLDSLTTEVAGGLASG
ncbi:MAG: SRPBCC family protein [Thermoanaerobaculia bacterium]|jgi:uncharacterized protein YndB with AHSA1/START domain|nr:SRPBCC family protein [Thermoanaerobaculia bacterium]MBP9823391.1 SRPBCC family protein [Thermoanaerobaculia bacterium]